MPDFTRVSRKRRRSYRATGYSVTEETRGDPTARFSGHGFGPHERITRPEHPVLREDGGPYHGSGAGGGPAWPGRP